MDHASVEDRCCRELCCEKRRSTRGVNRVQLTVQVGAVLSFWLDAIARSNDVYERTRRVVGVLLVVGDVALGMLLG